MQRCTKLLCAPFASRGLGLQGPPHAPPAARPGHPGRRRRSLRAGPAPGPAGPALATGPAPGRSALWAAGGGQRSGEVGSQLRPRVPRTLSRRSWPGPGCSHGKARGRGAGPRRAGPSAPGGSAGTRGAAAPAVRGGRRCLRLRAGGQCWWTALRRSFQVSPSNSSGDGADPESWGAAGVLGPRGGSVLSGGGGGGPPAETLMLGWGRRVSDRRS